MNYLISKKTSANVIAFALAIFSTYLIFNGAFYNKTIFLQCGLGILLSTFCVGADLMKAIKKDIPDFIIMKVAALIFVCLLYITTAGVFAWTITLNPIYASGLTIVFTAVLVFLGRIVKNKDMKIM